MALPMMQSPYYTVEVPSTGKKISFRPFTVREEKALLLAQQSEDTDVMVDTLKQIIKGCVKEDIDPNKLAIFDIEFLFTQIRAKSVGELAELVFTCQHCESEEGKNKMHVSIDLTKIPIIRDPKFTNRINLFDDTGVIMRYPNLDTFKKAEGKLDDVNAIMAVVIDCIEAIYNGDEMFYANEQTPEELEEFVMNLTKAQFDQIEEFFVHVPKFKQDIEFDCPNCGTHNITALEGTASFF